MVADIRAHSQNFIHKDQIFCNFYLYLLMVLLDMETCTTCIYALFARAEPAQSFPALPDPSSGTDIDIDFKSRSVTDTSGSVKSEVRMALSTNVNRILGR